MRYALDATTGDDDDADAACFLQTGLAALAAPSIAHAQAPRGSITLLSYSGIFQDNYTRAVVEPFRRAFPTSRSATRRAPRRRR